MNYSLTDLFLWVIYPYVCLTIFVLGNIYRYNHDQFGWTSKSSELLEKKRLKWGSMLFHYGLIFAFFGHVAGILVPAAFFNALGITENLYHTGAVWFGIPAGVISLIGAILLSWRRVSVKRIVLNSSITDKIVIFLLTLILLLGVLVTVTNAPRATTFPYREYIGPWFRGLLTFQPHFDLMTPAPFIFKLHIFVAFLLFAIWPFSRLVHFWSLPLKYLNRRYVTYRKMAPAKAVNNKK